MLVNSHPDILHHLLFLSLLHSLVKVLRVGSRHQDDTILVQMIGGEVGAMPYLGLPDLVKPYMVVGYLERTESVMQLVEASKCFT